MNEINEFLNKGSDKSEGFVSWVKTHLTWENLFRVIGIVAIIFAIWLVYKVICKAIKNSKQKVLRENSPIILKILHYAYYIVIVMYVLGIFGIKLSALLGAAGIAGVAVGFAAQTSMSNLISGLFIVSEQVIKIGDAITVGDTTGIVDSIDALSVKVHTFDNQLVRIPNSKIIDSNMTNFSYYPVRRFQFEVPISYDTDMKKAMDTILKVPALCPTVLQDPAPFARFDGFGDHAIILTLGVYFKTDDLVQTKNDVFMAIKKVMDEADIFMPFDQFFVPQEGGCV